MPIYLIETDAAGLPLDPPVGWYGPVEAEIFVDWIAYERQCDDTFQVVPEIEFPTERHYRRDDWLCVGVRPPRAMPRGLRATLESDSASGTAPPGLIENPIECWVGDPSAAVNNVANYDNNDGGLPRGTWLFNSDVQSHATNVEPLAYGDDDFVLESVARYVASDGTFWRLLFSGELYGGSSPPLPAEPIAALAIARRTLTRPAIEKVRSIVLLDTIANQCATVERVPLPFFDDFEPQSIHWRPNGFAAGFVNSVWQPRPNGTQTVRIQTGYGPAVRNHRFSAEYGNAIAGMSVGFNNPFGSDFYGFTVGPGGGALSAQAAGVSIFLRDIAIGETITGGCGMLYREDGIADRMFWDIAGEKGSVAINFVLPGFPSWCELPQLFMSSIWPGLVDNILIAGD